MKDKRRIAIVLIVCALLSSACNKAIESEAGHKEAQPAGSTLSIDLNDDGKADWIDIAKTAGNEVLLTAQINLRNKGVKAQSLRFVIARDKQDGLCGWPVELISEPLDYEPDPNLGPLQGYRKSERAKGLRISDGECDDIHIYWNHDTQNINWWRP